MTDVEATAIDLGSDQWLYDVVLVDNGMHESGPHFPGFAAIDGVMVDTMKRNDVPGAAIAVVKNGAPIPSTLGGATPAPPIDLAPQPAADEIKQNDGRGEREEPPRGRPEEFHWTNPPSSSERISRSATGTRTSAWISGMR